MLPIIGGILLVVISICVLALFVALKLKEQGLKKGFNEEILPYEKNKYLLTKAERSFFGVLQSTIEEDHQIFVKVRLADLIKVKKGTEKRQSYLNKIISKHIDFLICDKESISPKLCIELDDKSHNKENKNDHFKNQALEASDLPLLRVKAKQSYSTSELKKEVYDLINEKPEKRSDQSEEASDDKRKQNTKD